MRIERLADAVFLYSVLWPLQKSLAKKPQTPLVVLLLPLERREWTSGNEAGNLSAWPYCICPEEIEEWKSKSGVQEEML